MPPPPLQVRVLESSAGTVVVAQHQAEVMAGRMREYQSEVAQLRQQLGQAHADLADKSSMVSGCSWGGL